MVSFAITPLSSFCYFRPFATFASALSVEPMNSVCFGVSLLHRGPPSRPHSHLSSRVLLYYKFSDNTHYYRNISKRFVEYYTCASPLFQPFPVKKYHFITNYSFKLQFYYFHNNFNMITTAILKAIP